MRHDAEPAAAPLAPPAADSLSSQLAGASWIDIDAGLSRVRGNEDKFRQLVRLFLREHRNDLEKISNAVADSS